jgi:hypothetical protein
MMDFILVTAVLLVCYFFHPGYHVAVQLLLNCDVSKCGGGTRSVPMLFAGCDQNDIPRPDFLDWAAPSLNAAITCRYNKRLAKRMRVPSRAGRWFKGNARTGNTGWLISVKKRI